MTLRELIQNRVLIWAFAVFAVGTVVLVAIQMWRGDALVCADRSIFAKSCPETSESLPSSAVIAFDRIEGCPDGWTEHERARGRFIVGVGRHTEHNQYGNEVLAKEVGDTGGEDQVRLEIKHMPKHSHRNPSRADEGSKEQVHALKATHRGEYGGKHARPTEVSGGGEPHENMPPYIAFRLCKKD